MLDVLNRIGYKTGKIVSRAEAHEKGLYHRVACGTLIDPQGYIILNKRGNESDIFPGRWIPIIGGHVLAGEDSLEAIMRESYEELGVSLKKEDIYQTRVTEMIDSSSISKGNNKEIIDFMIMNCETPLEEMKLDFVKLSTKKSVLNCTMMHVQYYNFFFFLNDVPTDRVRLFSMWRGVG